MANPKERPDPEMCIVVDDRTLGMWHICPDPTRYNYLSHLEKAKEGEYVVTWRIRVYANGEIFDSDDTFRWHQYSIAGVTDEMALACQHATTDAAWELLRGSLTLAEFQLKLLKMPAMYADPNPDWRPGLPIRVT